MGCSTYRTREQLYQRTRDVFTSQNQVQFKCCMRELSKICKLYQKEEARLAILKTFCPKLWSIGTWNKSHWVVKRNQNSKCCGEVIWKHIGYVFLSQDNNSQNLEQIVKKCHNIPTDRLFKNSNYIDCLCWKV